LPGWRLKIFALLRGLAWGAGFPQNPGVLAGQTLILPLKGLTALKNLQQNRRKRNHSYT
jgi:hypothetical protein